MSTRAPEFEISLRLADIGFRVATDAGDPPEFMEARFGAYRGSVPDAIALRVTRDESVVVAQPPDTEWPGALGMLRGDGSVCFERAGERVEYDPATRRARALVAHPRTTGLAPIEDPTALDTPLRLLLSYELPRADGLLLHAAGYGDERGAVVFAAASGGGKTTTANKLPPSAVLSDDQVAVRRDGDGWWAYALPFVGLYARATVPRRTRLRALVLLAKSEREHLALVRGGTALAGVLACSPYFVRNDPASARLLDLASELVHAVPVYQLATTRDAPVMPLVERLLVA